MNGRIILAILMLSLPLVAEPLSLRQAGEATLKNHPINREAIARVAADKARWGQSQAPFYPTVAAGIGYLTNEEREDGDHTYEQDKTLNLVGSQTLVDFGKRRNSSEQAKLSYEATEQASQAVQQALLERSARAYFTVLSAAQGVYIQKESLRLGRLRLEEARGLYDQGKRPLEDLSLAESDVSTILVALIDAEAAEQTARVRLANAMGLDESYKGPLVQCSLPFRDWALEPSLETAFESCPDLADARLRVLSAQSGVRAAQAGYRPDIFMTAGYGFLDNGFVPQDYSWELRLNMSFPLFNEPFLSQSIALAEAEEAQTAAREQAKANDVAGEVQVGLVEVRGNHLKARAARRAALKSYATYIVTWASYRLGKGSARDVSNAQRDLTQSLVSQNQIFTALQFSVLEMYRATGGLSVEVLPADVGTERGVYWPLFDQEVPR